MERQNVSARRKKDNNLGGFYYTCPICEKKFDFRSFSELQGDHIWPYSLFGETTWENYQLICGKCNKQKGNHLDGDVHRVLGSGKFRELVSMFLQEKVETGELPKDAVMRSLLAAKR